jgi:hypothetical protein
MNATKSVTERSVNSDQIVIAAWTKRRLTDGSKLRLGRTDREQGFIVRSGGIFPVSFRVSGVQNCSDGTSRLANRLNASDIIPYSGGHTHPLGQSGDVSPLPGPEDGQMAVATGKTAYVISRRAAFAIDRSSDGFEVRWLAGRPLTTSEQQKVRETIIQWNQNNGRSGVTCVFTPN